MAKDGKRVLFVCFNKLLASRIRDRVKATEYDGELVVRNLHHHFHEMINESSLASAFAEKFNPEEPDKDKRKKMYRELFPEYAFYAASELQEPPFDAIVIDEAQDLLTTANLDALGAMLRGGLQAGCWCVFLDSQDQVELFKNMDKGALDLLRAHGDRQRLTLNCRNTRPIARDTALVSRAKRRARARVDGQPVDFRTYKKRDKWIQQLSRVVEDLRTEGVSGGYVSVLLAYAPTKNEVREMEELGLVKLTESHVPSLGTTQLGHITWSTVSSFKGLENDVVILVGVKDIEDDWPRSVSYVGMSRARTRLHVILTEGCETKRRKRVKEHEEKRNSDVEMLL
jgi:superfamily I DNA/RNA helicase